MSRDPELYEREAALIRELYPTRDAATVAAMIEAQVGTRLKPLTIRARACQLGVRCQSRPKPALSEWQLRRNEIADRMLRDGAYSDDIWAALTGAGLRVSLAWIHRRRHELGILSPSRRSRPVKHEIALCVRLDTDVDWGPAARLVYLAASAGHGMMTRHGSGRQKRRHLRMQRVGARDGSKGMSRKGVTGCG